MRPSLRDAALLLLLALAASGCPGDGSDGRAAIVQYRSTPECLVIAGGFPSGFRSLPGTMGEAAVMQFAPAAVIGLDLNPEPPRRLATGPVAGFPDLSSPRCGGLRVDSDSDGRPDADRSDELGFRCQTPAPGSLRPLGPDRVALSTSGYEQILLVDPRTGELRLMRLAPPPPGSGFAPNDWPFWPASGIEPFQSGFSTRACVYGDGLLDSLDQPLGPNTRCDDSRSGFSTSFTADSLESDGKLFVVTSNLIRSSTAQFAPGTVLVFDLDLEAEPPRVAPRQDAAILLTSGYNPTSLSGYTTPNGRELVLVGVSGALALGTGPDRVLTQSAIDVIDAERLELIATIPLGRAGLGFGGLAIDPTGRIGLIGAAAERALFGIDLAALDAPGLGLGPETLPIVLDGMTPGYPDARLFTAEAPYVLPKRSDGPLDSDCSTQTSVAIKDDGRFAVTSDFCDGTIARFDLSLPASRMAPLDPGGFLSLNRIIVAAAPILPTATGEIRAIDRVTIRSGTPVVDFSGPDVHFTAGLPEGAVCGIRVDAI